MGIVSSGPLTSNIEQETILRCSFEKQGHFIVGTSLSQVGRIAQCHCCIAEELKTNSDLHKQENTYSITLFKWKSLSFNNFPHTDTSAEDAFCHNVFNFIHLLYFYLKVFSIILAVCIPQPFAADFLYVGKSKHEWFLKP